MPERRQWLLPGKPDGWPGTSRSFVKSGRHGADGPEKQCPACKLWKPVGAYARNNRDASGMQSRCKECSNADQRNARTVLPPVRPPGTPAFKTCPVCSREWPWTSFARTRGGDGLAGYCTSCGAAKAKRYRESRYAMTPEKAAGMLAAGMPRGNVALAVLEAVAAGTCLRVRLTAELVRATAETALT